MVCSASESSRIINHPGLRVAAHAVGHEIYLTGRMFVYLLGLKEPRFVTGFSSPEMDIAMMQGEVDARSQTQESIELTPELFEKGLVDFQAIIGNPKAKKHPRFSSLPDLESFGRSPREKSVLAMHRAFRLVGTPTIFPPGTPKDRVEILRKAMRQTFKDPAFARDLKKLSGGDPSPLLPEEQDALIKELPRDTEVVELFKKLLGAEPLPPR